MSLVALCARLAFSAFVVSYTSSIWLFSFISFGPTFFVAVIPVLIFAPITFGRQTGDIVKSSASLARYTLFFIHSGSEADADPTYTDKVMRKDNSQIIGDGEDERHGRPAEETPLSVTPTGTDLAWSHFYFFIGGIILPLTIADLMLLKIGVEAHREALSLFHTSVLAPAIHVWTAWKTVYEMNQQPRWSIVRADGPRLTSLNDSSLVAPLESMRNNHQPYSSLAHSQEMGDLTGKPLLMDSEQPEAASNEVLSLQSCLSRGDETTLSQFLVIVGPSTSQAGGTRYSVVGPLSHHHGELALWRAHLEELDL